MSQWVHCYNCSASYAVPATGWDGTCPRCHEGFVEVLEQQVRLLGREGEPLAWLMTHS